MSFAAHTGAARLAASARVRSRPLASADEIARFVDRAILGLSTIDEVRSTGAPSRAALGSVLMSVPFAAVTIVTLPTCSVI